MKYKYLFFDLDGTLTDSAPGIYNAVSFALEKMGHSVEDKNTLRPFIGPPLTESFRKFYHMNEEEIAEAIRLFHIRYDEEGALFENVPYEGIPELLSEIQTSGRKIILATSKPDITARRILERFDILKYFDHVDGATMDGGKNSKAEVLKSAILESGVTELSEAIMIGDRKYDVIGAKQCGLDTIGVLYGFGSREELSEAGARYLAEKVADILTLI